MYERSLTALVALLDSVMWAIDVSPAVHKFFLAPQLGNFRVILGKARAIRLYRRSVRRVPAYRHFIGKRGGPVVYPGKISLGDIPETDKESYIKKYPLLDKLTDGVLPLRGVMFDESSGSSGVPTSWVRGPKERRYIQRLMQVSFEHIYKGKNAIFLNTFSMGAWATGLNTTISLIGVSRVKSIGPDIVKVVATLKELGPDFNYVVAGYPPFLKQLTEQTDIDWQAYHISAIYGGEGISETMRTTLLEYFETIIGSYGASDLEINIAHETEFTIALRRRLIEDGTLRALVLKQNRGIIPSIFQYNPYDYVFETNAKGELVVTICRTQNISPRIRYNIHDLGHAEEFYTLRRLLTKAGHADLVRLAELDFGVLFHYGRSDLSVDYNGAVVGPEEVKQIIDADAAAESVNGFRLISYEDAAAHKHLLIAIETDPKAPPVDPDGLLATITTELTRMNLDFASAIRTAQFKPEIRLYEQGSGLFDAAHYKLKNDYVWNIDHARALKEGIVTK